MVGLERASYNLSTIHTLAGDWSCATAQEERVWSSGQVYSFCMQPCMLVSMGGTGQSGQSRQIMSQIGSGFELRQIVIKSQKEYILLGCDCNRCILIQKLILW